MTQKTLASIDFFFCDDHNLFYFWFIFISLMEKCREEISFHFIVKEEDFEKNTFC